MQLWASGNRLHPELVVELGSTIYIVPILQAWNIQDWGVMGIAEGDVSRDLLCPGNVWLVCSLCYEYLRGGHSMKLWRWSINRKGDLQDTGDGRAVGCWGCWCWGNLNVRRETCPDRGSVCCRQPSWEKRLPSPFETRSFYHKLKTLNTDAGAGICPAGIQSFFDLIMPSIPSGMGMFILRCSRLEMYISLFYFRDLIYMLVFGFYTCSDISFIF